jgi:hypothetical protein
VSRPGSSAPRPTEAVRGAGQADWRESGQRTDCPSPLGPPRLG